MKTIRFIIASLLTLACFTSFAQADLMYASRVNCLNTQGYYNYSGWSNYYSSSGSTASQWCTEATKPSYIFNSSTMPIMLYDLGSVESINSISFGAYSVAKNSIKDVTMEFYDTAGISGTPIYTKTYSGIASSGTTTVSLGDEPVKARYVKITMTDNYDGDRVGVGDIAFDVNSNSIKPSSVSANVTVLGGRSNNYLIDGVTTTEWCTKNAYDGTGKYYAKYEAPVFTYTFSDAQSMDSITVRGYSALGNSLKNFNLKFYDTDGNQITVEDSSKYSFFVPSAGISQDNHFSFPKVDGVAKVEMTVTENYWNYDWGGGDRVGVGDVSFSLRNAEWDSSITPIMYNQPTHIENIVRPTSAKFSTAASSAASERNIAYLYDGTGLNGGEIWYTRTPGSDYFYTGTSPSIEFTLPKESLYDSFSIWGYDSVGNQLTDFILELFNSNGDLVFADEFRIDQHISASQYATFSLGDNYLFETAKLTALDNAYGQFAGSGGDRLGFTEIAFYQDPNAIPEPSTWALLLLGFAGLMKVASCELRVARKGKKR